MNYYMDLIGNMNIRHEPDATLNNIIRVLPAGTRVYLARHLQTQARKVGHALYHI